MKTIRQVRFAYSPDGVFSQFSIDEDVDFSWVTIERPWYGNKRNISCIPIGDYQLELGIFHRGTADPTDDYPAYQVMDVPDRTFIKIHIANTMLDVAGCIGPGMGLGYINNYWAVIKSRIAFGQFMEAMEGDRTAILSIENLEGGIL